MGFQCPALRRQAQKRANETASARPSGRLLRTAASVAVIGLSTMTMGCAQPADSMAEAATVAPKALEERTAGQPQVGAASYYSHRFSGRRMASGGRFDPGSDTIAHRTLPFGTLVRVTNLQNGLSTTGTVQDRGPWTRGRIADVSPRIARQIDMIRSGIAQVEIVPVEIAEAPE